MLEYLKLARIGNVVIAFLSVVVSGVLCGVNVAGTWQIFAAGIAASMITAGGNSINDYYDIEIDRINRPKRPLPSGRVSPGQVRYFYFIITGAGIILSAAINAATFLIAASAALLVFCTASN